MNERVGRWYLPVIAGVAVMLVGLLAMLAIDRVMRTNAIEQTLSGAEADVELLAAGLESELDKFSLVPRVLAVDPGVMTLLRGDPRQQAILNSRLSDLAEQTGAAAIYLMDAQGLTLAASNWNLPTSFVGSNYGFRSYFSKAIERGSSTEFALGTVSRRPGLYIAQRVETGGRQLGVVAVKVEFDAIERSWDEAEAGVFVTDAEGVVLLTSRPEWRFRTTRHEDLLDRDTEQDWLRFGLAELKPLTLADENLTLSSGELVERIQPISPRGWELHLLVDPAERLSAAIAYGRLLVLLGLIVAVTVGALLIWWQRRREARAAATMAQRTANLRDQLLQANRLATLGQISAGLGHEIRQPLAAMRVYAENGERLINQGQTPAAAENFGKIVSLTGKLDQITEELLRFSRRNVHEAHEMPLAQAIDGALLLLHDRIARHGAIVVTPPPQMTQTVVRAEHVRLEQVLVNLLQNALDASPQGSQIIIEISLDDQFCLLSVADKGPGLSEEVRTTLFQPFATTKDDGLGLGLVISQEIMRALGGDLKAEEPDAGARFTMVIPRV